MASRRNYASRLRRKSNRKKRSYRRSNRSKRYSRVTRAVVQKELKVHDFSFALGANSITWDGRGAVDCLHNGVLFGGVPQNASAFGRVGNTILSRYLNMNLVFRSARAKAGSDFYDPEVDPTMVAVGGDISTSDKEVILSTSGVTEYMIDQLPQRNVAGIWDNNGTTQSNIIDNHGVNNVMKLNLPLAMDGAVAPGLDAYNVEYSRRHKFVRTVHRVLIVQDLRQADFQNNLPLTSIFGSGNVDLSPSTMAMLNPDNFGRYSILYDYTTATDADDPIKTLSVRSLKTNRKQRYAGPSEESGVSGSYFIIYMSRVDGVMASDIATFYEGGFLTGLIRHAFLDD